MNPEEHIIKLYCMVSEFLQKYQLRSRGFAPKLDDAEVITMEIYAQMQGHHTDVAIWRYFKNHWRGWFPHLGSYCNFSKHCANLRFIKEQLLAHYFPAKNRLHIIDGVPMPVCHYARSGRCRSLRPQSAYGYCAAKDEHYFGLRGHPLINEQGFIVACTYTAANVDERETLGNLLHLIKGILLADKGYISEDWERELAHFGIELQTLKRKNMVETRSKAFLKWLAKTRKKIETVISVLTECFAFNRIKARSIHHFINKAARKILAYNFKLLFKS